MNSPGPSARLTLPTEPTGHSTLVVCSPGHSQHSNTPTSPHCPLGGLSKAVCVEHSCVFRALHRWSFFPVTGSKPGLMPAPQTLVGMSIESELNIIEHPFLSMFTLPLAPISKASHHSIQVFISSPDHEVITHIAHSSAVRRTCSSRLQRQCLQLYQSPQQ